MDAATPERSRYPPLRRLGVQGSGISEDRSPHPFDFDAYAPAEIARRVESSGVAKANLPLLQTLALAVLAGAFIAFGGTSYTVVVTGSELGFGPTRLLGGVVFSLELVLVVIGGAELFNGNNLIAMAWADRRVTTGQLLWNWLLVYAGNVVGALGSAAAVLLSGILDTGGSLHETAAAIAQARIAPGASEAFFRGILCNVLVCLAVWPCFAAHTVTGKMLAIVFPVSAFVALGFEHSIANMYLIPVGLFAGGAAPAAADLAAMAQNIAVVTLGNIVGGTLLVALVYWLVYLRHRRD